MLHVWMGTYSKRGVTIARPDNYFNRTFDLDLLRTDFSTRLIESCADGAKMQPDGTFIHPIWGRHTMLELPSGVKTTLLAKYDKNVITNMVYCGNNCIPYIIEASIEEDVVVSSERYIYWYDSGLIRGKDKVHIMNDDSYVNDSWNYLVKWSEFSDTATIDRDGKITVMEQQEYWRKL